jgi:hypothetical protein
LGPTGGSEASGLSRALGELDAAASALSSAGRDCERACKAFASMQRSSDRICELNGPDDPDSRCRRARDRVDAAREKLRRTCGGCADG